MLDRAAPLATGSHGEAVKYALRDGHLVVTLEAAARPVSRNPASWWLPGEAEAPDAVLLVNHDLHLEIQIDAGHPIGKTDPAGVKDVVVEAALTSIMDCEDSVAAVDAEDKVEVYANWLGLMKGDLEARSTRGARPSRVVSMMIVLGAIPRVAT